MEEKFLSDPLVLNEGKWTTLEEQSDEEVIEPLENLRERTVNRLQKGETRKKLVELMVKLKNEEAPKK